MSGIRNKTSSRHLTPSKQKLLINLFSRVVSNIFQIFLREILSPSQEESDQISLLESDTPPNSPFQNNQAQRKLHLFLQNRREFATDSDSEEEEETADN